MAVGDTLYSARVTLETIERGRANVLRCPVYRDGALAAPSSGTVTVRDRAGTALVSAAAVTVTASVATYSLASATVASSDYGDGWTIEWALVMPDAVTHTFRQDAALVRIQLYPVLTDADLIRRVPALDPSGTSPITRRTDYQDTIDEAWQVIVRRLRDEGTVPWWLADPEAMRESHMQLVLQMIFADLALRAPSAESYAVRADEYRREYHRAWSAMQVRIQRDAETVPGRRRRAASPTVWLAGNRPESWVNRWPT